MIQIVCRMAKSYTPPVPPTMADAYDAVESGYETCDGHYTNNGTTLNGYPVKQNPNGAVLYWSGSEWHIGLDTSSYIYYSTHVGGSFYVPEQASGWVASSPSFNPPPTVTAD